MLGITARHHLDPAARERLGGARRGAHLRRPGGRRRRGDVHPRRAQLGAPRRVRAQVDGQTRAMSRALRAPLGFVLALTGASRRRPRSSTAARRITVPPTPELPAWAKPVADVGPAARTLVAILKAGRRRREPADRTVEIGKRVRDRCDGTFPVCVLAVLEDVRDAGRARGRRGGGVMAVDRCESTYSTRSTQSAAGPTPAWPSRSPRRRVDDYAPPGASSTQLRSTRTDRERSAAGPSGLSGLQVASALRALLDASSGWRHGRRVDVRSSARHVRQMHEPPRASSSSAVADHRDRSPRDSRRGDKWRSRRLRAAAAAAAATRPDGAQGSISTATALVRTVLARCRAPRTSRLQALDLTADDLRRAAREPAAGVVTLQALRRPLEPVECLVPGRVPLGAGDAARPATRGSASRC